MKAFFFSVADGFIPPSVVDPDEVRRLRAAIFQSWLGIGLTGTFGGLYALLGSPVSGLSILFLMVGLLLVPPLIQRGTSVFWLAHLLVGGTWLSTWLVSWRSGGFTSPAVVWNFMLPLCVYSVCGKRSALLWSSLSGAQILFFFLAQVADHRFPQDFDDATLAILRISGYTGVVLATVAVLLVVESAHASATLAKQEAQRSLDRQRILDDMHDGVGSQILGLLVRAKADSLSRSDLESNLEACLSDLRLIVDSLDPTDPSLIVAFGAARARSDAKSQALGIENHWQVDAERLKSLTPGRMLQLLRALQEMVANAQRHARTSRVDVSFFALEDEVLVLQVRDYGIGFDFRSGKHAGRGLKSLRARARRLGGHLEIEDARPGTLVRIRFS